MKNSDKTIENLRELRAEQPDLVRAAVETEIDTEALVNEEKPSPGRPRVYDRTGLIIHLQELARKLGRPPGISDLESLEGPSFQAYRSRFGTLNAAKKEAGLPVYKSGQRIDYMERVREAGE